MANILIREDQIDLKPNSIVDNVVIYFNRAQVHRFLKVNLQPGENIVEFLNLGNDIDETSIKTGAIGEGIEIGAASLITDHLFFFREKEDRNRYEEILSGYRELATLMDDKTTRCLENHIIRDLRDYVREALNGILLEEEIPLSRLRDALVLLEERMQQNSFRIIDTDRQLQTLMERVEYLKAELERIRALDRRVRNTIAITVMAEKEMEAEISISYILPGARWKASYDAKLDTHSGEVNFSYFGEISQTTGEEWQNVRLELSTSETKASLEIPKVRPLFVSGYEEKRDKTLYVQREEARRDLDEGPGAANALPELEPSVSEPVVALKKSGTVYHFEVSRPYSIPSDGLWHRVLIKETDLEGKVFFESTPEIMEYFYLRANLTNKTNLPLLPGRVSLYRNGSFMGRSDLEYRAQEEEFSLSFGIDEDLKVKRRQVYRYEKPKKLLLKNERSWYFEFILYNYKAKPEKVVLREAVYVSKIKEIEVEILESSTPGYKLSEDGIITWEINLPSDPFQYSSLKLEYKIASPKSFDLQALA